MGVLSEIRALREAVEGVVASLRQVVEGMDDLSELQRQRDPEEARIVELERSRARWEAEMEALLLRADSTFKGAANAEARARTMLRHHEKLDPLDEAGEAAGEETVRESDAPGGEAEALPPVRVVLATNNKAHAVRAKFGAAY